MVTSVVFLMVFVLCVAVGNIVHDWHDWFFGVVFGLAIYQTGQYIINRLERRR